MRDLQTAPVPQELGSVVQMVEVGELTIKSLLPVSSWTFTVWGGVPKVIATVYKVTLFARLELNVPVLLTISF